MPENLYKRGSVWWVRVKSNGQEFRKSLRTGALSVARKRAQAFKDDIEARTYDGEIKWEEAVVEWRKRIDVKESTRERYQISLRNCREALTGKYLSQINKGLLGEMISEQREAGASNATIRRNLTAVASVLDAAEARDWIEGNPARDAHRRIKERRDPIIMPSEADIDFVVSMAPGNLARLIRFAQYTGMRQGEIVSLEWKQVRGDAIDITKTKTDAPRSFEMDSRAVGTISGTEKHESSKVVFWHSDGLPYLGIRSQFRNVMARCVTAKEKAGEPFTRFRFHDLRHWYAVDFLRSGNSIYTLQKRLGHASIKTTEIYLKYLTPEEAAVAQNGSQIYRSESADTDGPEG